MLDARTIITVLAVCISSLLGILVSLLRYEFNSLVKALQSEEEARRKTDGLAMIAKDRADSLVTLLIGKGIIAVGELPQPKG